MGALLPDVEKTCPICGTKMKLRADEPVPEMCTICAHPRSLLRLFHEVEQMTTKEEIHARVEEFIAARPAWDDEKFERTQRLVKRRKG